MTTPEPNPSPATAVPAPTSNTAPQGSHAPARTTARGAVASAAAGALNFATLTARIATLTTSTLRLKEQMQSLMRETDTNAHKVRTVAEMCDAAGVDPQYTALVMESSTALHRVVQAARDVAEIADQAEVHARAFGAAHEQEYRGIHEAVQASGVQQPKAGFNAVR